MFTGDWNNPVYVPQGGRWSQRTLLRPEDRYMPGMYLGCEDDGLGGFFDFFKKPFEFLSNIKPIKAISRLAPKPLRQTVKTIGKGVSMFMPIGWINKELREDAFAGWKTTAKRLPQIGVGLGTGLVASGGNPFGAIAGGVLAAVSKGEGLKFKVFKSGILPGIQGAGVASAASVGLSALKSGTVAGIKGGFTAGIKSGLAAGKLESVAQAQQAFFGVGKFIPGGIETVKTIGQTTGVLPGLPTSPGALISGEGLKLASKFLPQEEAVSFANQTLEQKIAQTQGPVLRQGGVNPATGEKKFTFSGMTFAQGASGVVRDRLGNVVEVDYAKLPTLLAQSDGFRSMSEQEISTLKSDFTNRVKGDFAQRLRRNYRDVVKDELRKKFDIQVSGTMSTIKEYERKGGAWAQEARNARADIEQAWNTQWMPSVGKETDKIVTQQLPSLLDVHAEQVFARNLRLESQANVGRREEWIREEKAKIEKAKLRRKQIIFESKVATDVQRFRLNVPARASNRSRMLARQQARELAERPKILDAPQPDFLPDVSTLREDKPVRFIVAR